MTDSQPKPTFKFQSPQGWDLCRKILLNRLPFGPHDYQLRGITSILDGQDLLAVSATGSGKSGYIYMTLHIVLAILEDKSLCPAAIFPQNPAILVVYPTTSLEENQEAIMKKFGLSAKAINAITKSEAEKEGVSIWNAVEERINVILVSPEMLSTPGFGNLISSKKFRRRLIAIGVDEVHLLDSWGESFRPAFRQISFIRARFPDEVVTFGMTATLRVGRHEESVCRFLGYHQGNYTLLRRSNARPDIKFIFREWSHTGASFSYPKIDWIMTEAGKILIFCPTICYGFNVAVYIWNLDPRNAILHQSIRLFNSLNSPDYNRETLALLDGNVNSKITIATDKLSVGVDVSDFQVVVIIEPSDLDDLVQKAGRVGRDKTRIQNPKVIVYFPTQMMRDAKLFVETKSSNDAGAALEEVKKTVNTRKRRRKGTTDTGDISKDGCGGLYETVMAQCHVAEINRQYGNPTVDVPCSEACQSCASFPPPNTPTMCNCSGCVPETSAAPETSTKQSRKPVVPLHIRVTQDMRKVGKAQLHKFRELLWESTDENSTGMIPAESYLPDTLIDNIFDAFPTVLSKSTLTEMISSDGKVTNVPMATQLLMPFVRHNPALGLRSDELVELLWLIHIEFDTMREAKKAEARVKRQAKKQAQSTQRDNQTSTSSNSDSGADGDDE